VAAFEEDEPMADRPNQPAGYVTRPDDDLRDRPLGELLRMLAQETVDLVRKELDLAKAEIEQKGRKAGIGAGLFGGAGVAGLLALAALTTAVILLLDLAMPAWVAALLVAAVWGVVAAVLARSGKQKIDEATPPIPEQTIETVKEDAQWARTQMRSDKR
jgi:Putative Actinobacterial Holin-X, holin superfamily III